METSVFIARLIGPILVVGGLTGFFTPKAIHEIAREFLASRALLFLAGFLALLAGLAIVNTHNVWIAGWPVIITIFGWLAVIGGIFRMGFPALTKSVAETMLARPAGLRVSAVIQLALGAYLMFVSYL